VWVRLLIQGQDRITESSFLKLSGIITREAALFDTGMLGLLFHAGKNIRTVMQFFSKNRRLFSNSLPFLYA
jgi:hypothetical protein